MRALSLPKTVWRGRGDDRLKWVRALEAVAVMQRSLRSKNVYLLSTTQSPVPNDPVHLPYSDIINVIQVVSPRMASYQTSRESPNIAISPPPVPFLYRQRKLSFADEELQNAMRKMISTGLTGI